MNKTHLLRSAYILGLLILVQAEFVVANAATSGLTYSITDKFLSGGQEANPPVSLYVRQLGSQAIARKKPGADAKVTLVSNPAKGIRSASKGRGAPALAEVIDGPDTLKSGDKLKLQFAEWKDAATITAINHSLKPGGKSKEILGHKAQHHVLTVEVKLTQADWEGKTETVTLNGTSDLWTTPSLPFSWIPYTASVFNWSMAAVPLSDHDKRLASFLLNHYAQQLEPLGLLLRAEIKSVMHTAGDGHESKQESTREVVVADLKTDVAGMKLSFPNQAAMSAAQYKSFSRGLMMGGMMCSEPMAGSKLTLNSNQSDQITGQGIALMEASETDTGFVLNGADKGACIAITAVAKAPAIGSYNLFPDREKDAPGTPEGNAAGAILFRIQGDEMFVTTLESGTVKIEKGKGMLKGKGPTLVTDKNYKTSRLADDVSVDVSFSVAVQ